MNIVHTAIIVAGLVLATGATSESYTLSALIPVDVVRTIFVGRTVERILIVLIGGLALYFGFRLFDKAIVSDSSLDAGTEKYYLRLKQIGPGVFFALFGTIVCLYTLFASPEVATTQSPGGLSTTLKGGLPEPRGLGEKESLEILLWSLTTVESLTTKTELLTDEEQTALREAVRNLDSLKAMLVDQLFGKNGTYNEWRRLDALLNSKPGEFQRLPNAEKERFHQINELVSRTLLR